MKLIGPFFRLGLGGRLGSGRQWMSCIAIDDLAEMVSLALRNEAISGPVNAVMPEPVTNAEFTRTLARKCREGNDRKASTTSAASLGGNKKSGWPGFGRWTFTQ